MKHKTNLRIRQLIALYMHVLIIGVVLSEFGLSITSGLLAVGTAFLANVATYPFLGQTTEDIEKELTAMFEESDDFKVSPDNYEKFTESKEELLDKYGTVEPSRFDSFIHSLHTVHTAPFELIGRVLSKVRNGLSRIIVPVVLVVGLLLIGLKFKVDEYRDRPEPQ